MWIRSILGTAGLLAATAAAVPKPITTKATITTAAKLDRGTE